MIGVVPGSRRADVRARVGIIGAGLATQAIHLPTLARCADVLRVVAVSGRNVEATRTIAAAAGATPYPDAETLLADRDVDVVAVCSPDQLHARHIVAACEAGKRVIFCEKPLATTVAEIADIESAVRRSGARLVVGSMLAHDEAWMRALALWRESDQRATFVRSTLYLPTNGGYHVAASDLLPRAPRAPGAVPRDGSARYSAFRNMILSLATHVIPHVHSLLPGLSTVVDARWVAPMGYAVTLSDGDRIAELLAITSGPWQTSWTLESWSAQAHLAMSSPPSYIHAGSSTAVMDVGIERREWRSDTNAYESEWRYIAGLARGEKEIIPVSEVLDEIRLAHSMIAGAERFFAA